MKATIDYTKATGRVGQYRKENNFATEYSVLVPLKAAGYEWRKREGVTMHQAITLRIYNTQSTSYACVWLWGKELYTAGGGKAGGYGYHRPSAAVEKALSGAGIALSESIGGVGDTAIFEALAATAKAMGFRSFHIHNAHA